MAVNVTEFCLDAFGGGNPLQFLDLGNGLNVAMVRETSDRSHLLQVIPWILFGPDDYFPAADGDLGRVLAPGNRGVARLRTEHGVFDVERVWGGDRDGETLRVVASDGREYGAEYLARLVEGVTPKTYRSVFAFDLLRLRRLVRHDAYGREQIGRLAAYLRRKSPQLDTHHGVPEHNFQAIRSQLGELTDFLHAQFAGGPDEPAAALADPAKIRDEIRRLDDELAEAKAKLHQLQTEMAETQGVKDVQRVKTRLRDIRRELADSQPAKAAEAATVGEREADQRLIDRLAMVKQELRDLAAEHEDLRKQGKAVGSLKRFQQLKPQMEAVLLQEKSLVREEAAIEQLLQKISDTESRIEAERLQASARSELATTAGRFDSHARVRMDALAERMREAEREVQLAQERLTRAEAASHVTAEHLSRASALAAHPEDALAIQEAETRLAQLRELSDQHGELRQLEIERDDLQVMVGRLYARQLMPFHLTLALGAPFMVGVAMILYGLFLRRGNADWRLILLGFAAAVTSALLKISADRGTGDVLNSARDRLVRVQQLIDEITAVGEQSAIPGVALTRQIEDAERELARLQTQFMSREADPSPLAADRARETSSIESARLQLNDARRRDTDVKQRWRELMIELDLTPNLTPPHAREVLAERAVHAPPSSAPEASQLEFHVQQLRADVDRRREWLNVQAGQARQLAKELNYPVPSGGVAEQMDVLREALSEHKERMLARKQVLQSRKRVRQKQLRLKEQGRRVSEQRRKLEDDARQRKEQLRLEKQLKSHRIKALEKQRDELKQELQEIRDRYCLAKDSSLLELSDEELTSRWESQASRLTRIQDRLLKQSEQRGRYRALLSLGQREPALNGKSPPVWEQLVNKTQQITQAFDMAIRDGQDNSITANGHRYLYIELAAGYLQLLSAGQFVQINVQEEGAVALTDHQGQVAMLDDLRREHYANIYFSLWLARLECFAARGLRLPIVMEDPLEATDAPRRSIVAQLLIDFAAKGHQVILVTADPLNADLFAHLDVPIAELAQREPIPVSTQPPERDRSSSAELPGPPGAATARPAADASSTDEPLFPPWPS